MSFYGSLIWGSAIGTFFFSTLDTKYYNSLARNVGEPVKAEWAKDQVDAAKMAEAVFNGTIRAYNENFGKK